MKIFSVSQITRYIKAVLEEDVILSEICLEGELSNVKAHSSGHIYFTLKDSSAAINCVMFKQSADILKFAPTDGMKVVAWGRVSVFEKTGGYQLYVSALKPSGTGDLHQAYEQLKSKLEALGYFDTARKRPLPAYPNVVGLVTSGDGAAVADMVSVIKRRNKAADILLVPVKVQGEGAAQSIADGIALHNRYGAADVIIVGRGGGSFEDLWPFNEESVVEAVVNSAIPIVSAVGHETDFTLCDFAADLRAPTPSAAAELVVPELPATLHNLEAYCNTLGSILIGQINTLADRLTRLTDKQNLLSPLNKLYNNEIYAETLLRRLDAEASRRMAALRQRFEHKTALLESLSPLSTLTRGYAAVHKGSALVTSINQLSPDDKINVKFSDGKAECKVISLNQGD